MRSQATAFGVVWGKGASGAGLQKDITMRLKGIRRSKNVEIRGSGPGRRRASSKAGGVGIVGLLVILGVGYVTGIDVSSLLQSDSAPQQHSQSLGPQDEAAIAFSSQVLSTTEDVWAKVFPEQLGRSYVPPRLVIFKNVTQSGCGGASGATGPFYCPADQTAYLDTSFFGMLSQQLGARGDFAAAYVIAHEVAHHVQNELGILGQVSAQRQRVSKVEANALTVKLELMADCLSGVWARNVQGLMERGDLKEALNAARRIGDDHLQRQAGRVPQPHTFTHGTSEQRARWFGRGYDTGLVGQCDTFAAAQL